MHYQLMFPKQSCGPYSRAQSPSERWDGDCELSKDALNPFGLIGRSDTPQTLSDSRRNRGFVCFEAALRCLSLNR